MTKSEALRILGLQTGYTDDELKKAHRKMIFKYHPDKGGDKEVFLKVQEAYNNLRSETFEPERVVNNVVLTHISPFEVTIAG